MTFSNLGYTIRTIYVTALSWVEMNGAMSEIGHRIEKQ
jgi:hypothetical protein